MSDAKPRSIVAASAVREIAPAPSLLPVAEALHERCGAWWLDSAQTGGARDVFRTLLAPQPMASEAPLPFVGGARSVRKTSSAPPGNAARPLGRSARTARSVSTSTAFP